MSSRLLPLRVGIILSAVVALTGCPGGVRTSDPVPVYIACPTEPLPEFPERPARPDSNDLRDLEPYTYRLEAKWDAFGIKWDAYGQAKAECKEEFGEGA